LYGCEIWSLTLRAELRLKALASRLLGRVFELNKDEVTGGWRKLHNEELHSLYSSPNIIRTSKSKRMRWVGDKWNVCKVFYGKDREGKRPLGRPKCR
jgi:hypothetical protein